MLVVTELVAGRNESRPAHTSWRPSRRKSPLSLKVH